MVAERARDDAGRLPHGGGRRRGFIRPRIGRVGLTDALETKTRKRSAARPALTTPFSVLFLKPYVKPFEAIINVFGLSITGE